MNLIEVLMPTPNDFFVFTANREKAYIQGYNHINIDFLPQISYVNGERNNTTQPTIFYTVFMSNENKLKLFTLFNNEFNDLWQTKDCYVGIKSKTERVVGSNEYIFKGRISAVPSFLKSATSNTMIPRLKEIKISLCLDNVGVGSLYKEVNSSYEEYYKNNEISRFELMEME